MRGHSRLATSAGPSDVARQGRAHSMAMTDANGRSRTSETEPTWRCPTLSELFHRPLHGLGILDRSIVRLFSYFVLPTFECVRGLEHVQPDGDPFVLALNHATRFE